MSTHDKLCMRVLICIVLSWYEKISKIGKNACSVGYFYVHFCFRLKQKIRELQILSRDLLNRNKVPIILCSCSLILIYMCMHCVCRRCLCVCQNDFEFTLRKNCFCMRMYAHTPIQYAYICMHTVLSTT